MSDERPDWVDERARCTLQSKFEELTSNVEFDVRQVNRQAPEPRHGQRFEIEELSNGGSRVRRFSEARPRTSTGFVTFELDGKRIVVRLPGESSFHVIPQWNESELRCDLLVDGEVLELWRISQKALGSFFFEEED